MARLLQELLVGPKREVCWIVDGNFQVIIIFQYERMIGAIEWDIMSSVPAFWNSNALDHTHATWENGVMTFHSHNHGYGWYISKDSNKVGMQLEHFVLLNVKRRDATKEFEELHNDGICIRIWILRFVTTRNDSHTKDEP